MVSCLAAGEAAERSEAFFTVVEGTLAAMGIVVVVSAAGEQTEPEKPGAQEKLWKSEMQWKPEMLLEPEMSCESWELPESKKQGKLKYLWEPWQRSKPLVPGAQETLSKSEMQWKAEM